MFVFDGKAGKSALLALKTVTVSPPLLPVLAGTAWWLCSCRGPPGSSRAGRGCCLTAPPLTYSPKVSEAGNRGDAAAQWLNGLSFHIT